MWQFVVYVILDAIPGIDSDNTVRDDLIILFGLALALREPRALAQALGAARSTGRELARDARTVIVALGAEISRPLLAVCQ